MTKVALKKIEMLKERDDYVDQQKLSDESVKLNFTTDRCIVDKFGRVTWI